MLMMSIDGAQLYRMKQSDCWIYIWVILDHAPDTRYKKKHIIPGAIIPGPNKPKDIDSFLFPGLYHLAALQKEGLKVWDAAKNQIVICRPFLAIVSADSPAMAWISGLVGHQGKHHCRFGCPIVGRRKPGGSTYYPCCSKPDNYNVDGSDHEDVDIKKLVDDFKKAQISGKSEEDYRKALRAVINSSLRGGEYEKNRLETGITKPSIFDGLPSEHTFGVPGIFTGDIMHLPALNIPDLFINLFRGKVDCEAPDSMALWKWKCLVGDNWVNFGKDVADATPFIPGQFDRPPRNPEKKISSGYKAWSSFSCSMGWVLAFCTSS